MFSAFMSVNNGTLMTLAIGHPLYPRSLHVNTTKPHISREQLSQPNKAQIINKLANQQITTSAHHHIVPSSRLRNY